MNLGNLCKPLIVAYRVNDKCPGKKEIPAIHENCRDLDFLWKVSESNFTAVKC
jgi:hypothetical protein